jgi:F0F1-type ATP synthase assembly protein I
MSDNKDYTASTLEALLMEEKKLKKNEIMAAALIGFFIGVIVFGLIQKGFGFLYMFLSIGFIAIIYKGSQRRKQKLVQIQAAINEKKKN